jgi:hypothetical protein
LDGGSARRKAATYTQNKRTQTPMPLVGFEPTIPVFERAKTVHALERAATVIDEWSVLQQNCPRLAVGITVCSEVHWQDVTSAPDLKLPRQ